METTVFSLKAKLQEFSAAHRMLDLPGSKCKHLHGHNFWITVTLGSEKLNEHGVIIDFLEIQKSLDHWIQDHLDHSVIVSKQDEALLSFLKSQNQRHYILTEQNNTTVERMAEHLFFKFNDLLMKVVMPSVQVIEVEIWETQNAGAAYGVRGSTLSGHPCR